MNRFWVAEDLAQASHDLRESWRVIATVQQQYGDLPRDPMLDETMTHIERALNILKQREEA